MQHKVRQGWWLRMLRKMLLPAMLVTGAASCGPTNSNDGEKALDEPVSSGLVTGPITVLDVRTFQGQGNPACARDMFSANLSIRNDAYHKRVGIVWTNNNWATVHTSYAQYEGSQGNGYEQWRVVEEGWNSCSGVTRVGVEFAAFVEMNGRTSWDPHNNYHTDGAVTVSRPVHLRSRQARLDGSGAFVEGDVRVLNLPGSKRVTVRYTEDDWGTHQDIEAQYADSDRWTFRIDPASEIPDRVQFAVRYLVGSEEYWDNNEHANYAVRLRPIFEPGGPGHFSPTNGTVSGIMFFHGRWVTDLPMLAKFVRLDDGAWQAENLDRGGIVLSTLPLNQGAHRAEFGLESENGLATHTIQFVVDNHVEPLQHWVPSANRYSAQGYSAEMTYDGSGRIYLLSDRVNRTTPTIIQYEHAGAESFVEMCDLPAEANILSISADVDGSVYAAFSTMETVGLVRCLPSGGIDPNFGQRGTFDLAPYFRVSRAKVVVRDGYAYMVDMCAPPGLQRDPGYPSVPQCDGSRVVRVRLADSDAALADYPEDPPSFWPNEGWWQRPGPITHDGQSLWLLRNGDPALLLRFGVNEAGEFVLLASARVSDTTRTGGQKITRASAIARDSQGVLWATSFDGYMLVAMNTNADVLGAWRGGGGIPGLYYPGDDYLGGFQGNGGDGDVSLVPREGQGGVHVLSQQPAITSYQLAAHR